MTSEAAAVCLDRETFGVVLACNFSSLSPHSFAWGEGRPRV